MSYSDPAQESEQNQGQVVSQYDGQGSVSTSGDFSHLFWIPKTQHRPHMNLSKCLTSLQIQAPTKQRQTFEKQTLLLNLVNACIDI